MKLPIYQIDAFASAQFKGNPAAICPLTEWISEELMQNIALENNLSETAFFVAEGDGTYRIRYFTPTVEIDLCGHATLAAAHLIFNVLNLEQEKIVVKANKEKLVIHNNQGKIVMNFPANEPVECPNDSAYEMVLGQSPLGVYANGYTCILLYESAVDIAAIQPNFSKFDLIDYDCIIISAKGKDCDFVSRVFCPKVGIDEDPVTGFAHTLLIPFWSKQLDQQVMFAKQISKRGGDLFVEYLGERVIIAGNACLFLTGEIEINL